MIFGMADGLPMDFRDWIAATMTSGCSLLSALRSGGVASSGGKTANWLAAQTLISTGSPSFSRA